MKVAIITDTHYGARKGSKLFHDYFEKFYDDVFFPTLDKEGIDTVIHMCWPPQARYQVQEHYVTMSLSNVIVL